jgi:hypothetical protein
MQQQQRRLLLVQQARQIARLQLPLCQQRPGPITSTLCLRAMLMTHTVWVTCWSTSWALMGVTACWGRTNQPQQRQQLLLLVLVLAQVLGLLLVAAGQHP